MAINVNAVYFLVLSLLVIKGNITVLVVPLYVAAMVAVFIHVHII